MTGVPRKAAYAAFLVFMHRVSAVAKNGVYLPGSVNEAPYFRCAKNGVELSGNLDEAPCFR